ncbi:MAG: hypothetical protein L0332_23500 [Chloroflexi bacterium]|nr:hypothetical protein [Chloroflexota bacterium]
MATALEVNDALAYLQAAYPNKELPAATLRVYEEMLANVDAQAIWMAIWDYLREGNDWRPSPSRLVAMALGRRACQFLGRDEAMWLASKAQEFGFQLSATMQTGDCTIHLAEALPELAALAAGDPGPLALLIKDLAEETPLPARTKPLSGLWAMVVESWFPQFEKTFRRTQLVEFDGGAAVVQVDGEPAREIITARLLPRIEQALSLVANQPVSVQLVEESVNENPT